MNSEILSGVVGISSATLGSALTATVILPLLKSSIENWMKDRSRRIADLENQVIALRDNHVKHIEEEISAVRGDMDRRFEASAAGRKELHRQMEAKVNLAACEKMHARLDGQLDRVEAIAVTLARTEESVRTTAKFVGEVNERVLGTMRDVARLEGSKT